MSLSTLIGLFLVRVPWTPPCTPTDPTQGCIPSGWLGL